MNGQPDDLHDALRDRFEATVFVPRPSPEAMKALDPDLVEVVRNAYSNPENITLTYREARAFMDLRKIVSEEDAAKCAFKSNYKDILTSLKMGAKV